MRFKRMGRYRHRYCRDIDILVSHVVRQEPEYTDLEVFYLSQRSSNLFSPKLDVIRVFAKQYENWTAVESDFPCNDR
jgi:hypothetical protein